MYAMKLMVQTWRLLARAVSSGEGKQTTSIADGMTTLISTPERRDSGPTILASDNDSGTVALKIQGSDINRRWGISGLVILRLCSGLLSLL
jgi:hypothetical protein